MILRIAPRVSCCVMAGHSRPKDGVAPLAYPAIHVLVAMKT